MGQNIQPHQPTNPNFFIFEHMITKAKRNECHLICAGWVTHLQYQFENILSAKHRSRVFRLSTLLHAFHHPGTYTSVKSGFQEGISLHLFWEGQEKNFFSFFNVKFLLVLFSWLKFTYSTTWPWLLWRQTVLNNQSINPTREGRGEGRFQIYQTFCYIKRQLPHQLVKYIEGLLHFHIWWVWYQSVTK